MDQQIYDLQPHQVQTNISYMDGLGRPIQRIHVEGSPNYKDIIQSIAYDNLGRSSIQYLPYASNTSTGDYQPNALQDQLVFYNTPGKKVAIDNSPFAETKYDGSPLSRIIEEGSYGEAWQPGQGHTVKTTFSGNTLEDN